MLILLHEHVAQQCTRRDIASLQSFVPATCPTKFNNYEVELRATCRGDKIVARFVLHENKSINSHEGTCRCNMSLRHFLVCEVAVILSQLHVPATRPCLISPECVRYKILSLLHVAATCPCKMSPRVQPPLFLPLHPRITRLLPYPDHQEMSDKNSMQV